MRIVSNGNVANNIDMRQWREKKKKADIFKGIEREKKKYSGI